MKGRRHQLAAIGLAVLLAGCIVAWLPTRDASPLRIAKKAPPAPILLAIFGAPTQMPAIIGLGDWVEINGVGGEAMEVGIPRTVWLENGQLDHWPAVGRRAIQTAERIPASGGVRERGGRQDGGARLGARHA